MEHFQLTRENYDDILHLCNGSVVCDSISKGYFAIELVDYSGKQKIMQIGDVITVTEDGFIITPLNQI